MKKRLIILGIVIMFLIGCASMRDTSNLMIDEYVTNIEIAKKDAVKIATISEFKTCFIRACLGSHIEKLPYEMVTTLDKIDLLLEKIGKDYNLMTDCQKGQVLGLWTRLTVLGILEVITEVITEINPRALADLL